MPIAHKTLLIAALCLVAASFACSNDDDPAAPGEPSGVRVPGDFPTLQAAVDAAEDGDEIIIAAGTYKEAVVVPVKSLVIRSESNDPADVIFDGSDNDENQPTVVFEDDGEADVVFRALTFTGGQGRGLSIRNGHADATFRIENVVFTANNPGGGLFSRARDLVIDNCEFTDHEAYIWGAAMIVVGNTVVTNSVFRNNDAIPYQTVELTQSGGIYCLSEQGFEGSYLEVRDCVFEENHCTDYGGAIQVTSNHEAKIINNIFRRNSADACAGSIYVVVNMFPVVIRGNLFDGDISPRGAAVGVHFGQDTKIRANTFVNCVGGEALRLEDSFNITVERNLLAFNEKRGIRSINGSRTVGCNNAYGNPDGDYAPPETGSNMSIDPLFCDRQNGDYHVASGSPCLPDYNQCSVAIGAYGEACAPAVKLGSNE